MNGIVSMKRWAYPGEACLSHAPVNGVVVRAINSVADAIRRREKKLKQVAISLFSQKKKKVLQEPKMDVPAGGRTPDLDIVP